MTENPTESLLAAERPLSAHSRYLLIEVSIRIERTGGVECLHFQKLAYRF